MGLWVSNHRKGCLGSWGTKRGVRLRGMIGGSAPLVVGRIQSSFWKQFGKGAAGPEVILSGFLTWSEPAVPSLS